MSEYQKMFDAVLRKYAALIAYGYESSLRESDDVTIAEVRGTIGVILASTVTGKGPEWCDSLSLLTESERSDFRRHLLRDVEVAYTLNGVMESPEVWLSKSKVGPAYGTSVYRGDPEDPDRVFTVTDGDYSDRDQANDWLVSLMGDLGVEVSELRFSLMTPESGYSDAFKAMAFTLVPEDADVHRWSPDVGKRLVDVSARAWELMGEDVLYDTFVEGVKLWLELDDVSKWPSDVSGLVRFHRFAVIADNGFVIDGTPDRDGDINVRSVVPGRPSRYVHL